jgi:uncharacterized protein YgiM (DUF1202 family)
MKKEITKKIATVVIAMMMGIFCILLASTNKTHYVEKIPDYEAEYEEESLHTLAFVETKEEGELEGESTEEIGTNELQTEEIDTSKSQTEEIDTSESQTEKIGTSKSQIEEIDTSESQTEEEIKFCTVDVDTYLNIRKKPSTDSEIVGMLLEGNQGKILKTQEDWIKIDSNGVKGWVKKSYVTITTKEKKIKKAKVTAKTLKLRAKDQDDSQVLVTLKKGESFQVVKVGKNWVKINYTPRVSGYVSAKSVTIEKEVGFALSNEEVNEYSKRLWQDEEGNLSSTANLLAALCEREAGDNYAGSLAVANVVLNRVKSKHYPNTIKEVIYQKSQFTGVNRGILNLYIDNPDEICIQAVKDALSGYNNIAKRVSFRTEGYVSPSVCKNYVIIGGNIFFDDFK